MQIPVKNYKKIAILCVCTLIGGLLFVYAIFPPILRAVLRSQVILKPGTQMREMYEVLPFPLIFKMYLFHVDNPDEVQAGGKPHLREIGPFVFEEWKDKVDIVDDPDEDTIEFTEIKTFIFSPELSSPLTGDEQLTMIHPLLTGIPLTVNVDRAPMLPLIAKAVDIILDKPSSIFWTGRAMDMLFDGVPLDCSSTNFASNAVCSVFGAGEVKAIWPIDNPAEHYKYAIIGGVNGTHGARFKTLRGVKNLRDLGRVVEINGEPELDAWDGDECNTLRGTEGSIFAPFRPFDEPIWAFEAGICRSMLTTYIRPSSYSGLPTSRHEIHFGDLDADETQHCYCADGICPPNGTLQLFQCLGVPIVASYPHFLDADPKVSSMVASGLYPDHEKHMIFLDMESISGTPLRGAKRVQFNIELQPLEAISYMQNVPQMLFPMMWVEEGANLNKTYVNMLKYQLFLGLKLVAAVKWICIIVGTVGTVAATVLHMKQSKAEENLTHVQHTIQKVQSAVGNESPTKSIDSDENAIGGISPQRPASRY